MVLRKSGRVGSRRFQSRKGFSSEMSARRPLSLVIPVALQFMGAALTLHYANQTAALRLHPLLSLLKVLPFLFWGPSDPP